jgi:hypothetical protein
MHNVLNLPDLAIEIDQENIIRLWKNMAIVTVDNDVDLNWRSAVRRELSATHHYKLDSGAENSSFSGMLGIQLHSIVLG